MDNTAKYRHVTWPLAKEAKNLCEEVAARVLEIRARMMRGDGRYSDDVMR